MGEAKSKVDRIFRDYLTRRRQGEPLRFRTICEQHPDCEQELHKIHERWRAFQPLQERLQNGESPAASQASPALLQQLASHSPTQPVQQGSIFRRREQPSALPVGAGGLVPGRVIGDFRLEKSGAKTEVQHSSLLAMQL